VDDMNALAEAIERTVSGPVWHGSALSELLRDVSASDAAFRPISGAHSIWELVLHISAWAAIVESWMLTDSSSEPSDAEDWPPIRHETPEEWKSTLASLSATHMSLALAVRNLDPSRLARRVPGRQYNLGAMLRGVSEHGAYHGGQIALLTRALTDRRTM
jgi:uncharacterized damage-inducible protein DinB